MTVLTVVLGLVAVLAVWVVATYDALLSARDRTHHAWRILDAQLRRRHALAAGAADPEVAAARDAAAAATEPFERAKAERRLAAALAATRTPPAELAEVQRALQAARRSYNADVRHYLTRKRRFPATLVAGLGDFPDPPYFELDSTRARPLVAHPAAA